MTLSAGAAAPARWRRTLSGDGTCDREYLLCQHLLWGSPTKWSTRAYLLSRYSTRMPSWEPLGRTASSAGLRLLANHWSTVGAIGAADQLRPTPGNKVLFPDRYPLATIRYRCAVTTSPLGGSFSSRPTLRRWLLHFLLLLAALLNLVSALHIVLQTFFFILCVVVGS